MRLEGLIAREDFLSNTVKATPLIIMLGQRKGKRIAHVVGAGAAVMISGALLLKTFPHLGNGLYNFLVGKANTDHLSDNEEDNNIRQPKAQPTTISSSYSSDRVPKKNYAKTLKASDEGGKSILHWAKQKFVLLRLIFILILLPLLNQLKKVVKI